MLSASQKSLHWNNLNCRNQVIRYYITSMATEVSRILLCSISLLINCPSCNCRVFHKILWQVPVPVKKKDPPRSENKFRAFIKRSSEPLLHMQNQQQVRKNTLFPRNRDTYIFFILFYLLQRRNCPPTRRA